MLGSILQELCWALSVVLKHFLQWCLLRYAAFCAVTRSESCFCAFQDVLNPAHGDAAISTVSEVHHLL